MSPRARIVVVLALALAALSVAAVLVMQASIGESGSDETAPASAAAAAEPTVESQRTSAVRASRRRASSGAVPDAEGVEDEDEEQPGEGRSPVPSRPLRIHVVNSGSRQAVVGARVVAEDEACAVHEAVTDARGIATFDPPIVGDYARIRVSGDGYAAARAFADKSRLRSGGTIEVSLVAGVSISGIVLEAGTGFTIAGASVTAALRDERRMETVSGVDGRFVFDGLPAATRSRLLAQETHHVAGEIDWDASKGTSVEFRLDRAGAVRGIVRLADFGPAAWVTVEARAVDRQWWDRARPPVRPTATTDAQGAFVLGGLTPGVRWVVFASRPGLGETPPSEPVTFGDDRADAVCDLAFLPPAIVEVRVLSPAGAPVPGARVALQAGRPDGGWLACDEQGFHRFELHAPASCRVVARAPGFPIRGFDAEAVCGRVVTVEARLEPGVEVRGVVVDDAGAPVADAEVQATFDATIETGRSGAGGAFRIEGIPAGPCRLDAHAEGHSESQAVFATAPVSDARLVLRRFGRIELRLRGGRSAADAVFAVTVARRDGGGERSIQGPAGEPLLSFPCEPGDWRVTLLVPEFAPLSRDVSVRPGETAVVSDLSPDPGLTVRGRVVDKSGSPVQGARVQVEPRSGAIVFSNTVSDRSGRFAVEHVAGGPARVKVCHPRFLDAESDVEIAAGGAPLVVTLRRNGALAGVLRHEGDPVPNVTIEASRGSGDDEESETVLTDAAGEYRFELAPGAWRILVPRETGEPIRYDVEIEDGQAVRLELTR